MILCLETATPVCSVALNDGCCTLAVRETEGQNAHSEKITNFIREAMETASIDYRQLDAVAVSKGPGSYTGLRIGVSTAKGICYAADLPLMAIDTLEAMAYGMKAKLGSQIAENDLLVPMIDARRMEVYTLGEDGKAKAVVVESEQSLLSNSPKDGLTGKAGLTPDNEAVFYFGDGAAKCQSVLTNPDWHYMPDIVPEAQYVGVLAEAISREQSPLINQQLAYYEPFYLKEFIAAQRHVKGLK